MVSVVLHNKSFAAPLEPTTLRLLLLCRRAAPPDAGAAGAAAEGEGEGEG